jgi:hypothetical protein
MPISITTLRFDHVWPDRCAADSNDDDIGVVNASAQVRVM